MKRNDSRLLGLALSLLLPCLAACTGGKGEFTFLKGSGGPVVTIQGSVSGLSGAGLVLQNNGADNLMVTGGGSFTFPIGVAPGGVYNVSVLTQPVAADGTPQTCTVAGGTGTATGSTQNVTVTCAAKTGTGDAIGGSVAGLAGTGLVLAGSDGTQVAVGANGTFTLVSGVAAGTPYSFSVVGQPAGQQCSVVNSSGTTGVTDVSSIVVSCHAATAVYTVGGSVTGLAGTGASITLVDNGHDPLILSQDGSFTFGLSVPDGGVYSVSATTVGSDSQSITCMLSGASGVVHAGNVTSIGVTCQVNGGGSAASYTVGGTVQGLTGGAVTLTDNGGDTQIVQGNGPFTFATALMAGSTYNVTAAVTGGNGAVKCTVAGGSGTVAGTDVSNVVVTCVQSTILSLTVQGLRATLPAEIANPAGPAAALILQDPVAGQLVISRDGTYQLPFPLAPGSGYAVTIATQPGNTISSDPVELPQTDLVCSLPGGSGTASGAGITLSVTCVDHPLGFAWVTSGAANTLQAYLVAGDGTLVQSGDPVTTGTNPSSVAVNQQIQPVLYVTAPGAGTLATYTADTNTGIPFQVGSSLNGLPGAAATALAPFFGIDFLLIANGTSPGSAALFDVDTASPTAVGGPAAAGNAPAAVAFATPSDTANQCNGDVYAYLANSGSDSISTYSLTANGITALSTTATGTAPSSLAVYDTFVFDPASGFVTDVPYVYAANSGDGTISTYTAACATGQLTRTRGVPLVAVGTGLRAIAPMTFADLGLLSQYPGPLTYLYADAAAGVFAFPISAGLLGGAVGAPVAFGTTAGPLTTFYSTFRTTAATGSTATITVSAGFQGTVVPGAYVVDDQGVIKQGTTVKSVSDDQQTITLSAAPTKSVAADDLSFIAAFVYVADLNANTITAMIANPFTGQLTPVGKPVAVGRTPTAIQVISRPNLIRD